MNKDYYIGDFRKDGLEGPNRGWIVGKFIESGPRLSDDVEIKYWQYKSGEQVKSYLKTSEIIECTFILRGRTKCIVGDQEVELKTGDYIVIEPGTPNNTVAEIIENVEGLTIKAPSDPSAKKIVGQS